MEAGPDLMSIGQHCSVEDCRQRDFLPFVCDCCQATFCLEHRTYREHQCPKAGGKEPLTIVCPICAKAVKCEGEDPHIAFDRHSKQVCFETSTLASYVWQSTFGHQFGPSRGIHSVPFVMHRTATQAITTKSTRSPSALCLAAMKNFPPSIPTGARVAMRQSA
jgi:hypothetical protein